MSNLVDTDRLIGLSFMVAHPFISQISIYGKNFCASARDAFFLLMRNVMR